MQDRKLAAIMFADIVSYSRLMGSNEGEALKLLEDFENISAEIVREYEGVIIKKNGDQIFCEFTSAKNAVDASLELQNKLSQYNDSRPKDFKLEVRIGIHIGDVVKREDGDIHGDGVNVAARIQPLAAPGGICISGAVSDAISSHPDYDVVSKGEQELKNILQKHSIFQVKTGHETIELGISNISKTSVKQSSNTKYWLLASPFIIILFIFLMNKVGFSVFEDFMKISDDESPKILLFGDVFSDKENIEDIRWFYQADHQVTLPDELQFLTLPRTELNNIYDELLSSLRINMMITNVDIDTKYDLDEFYKKKNDLVPDYKLKVFRFLKNIATGELDLSDMSPESNAMKYFKDIQINSPFYIMGQYHQVQLGYFPSVYKLSFPYEGNDYLMVGHIKFDDDPDPKRNNINSKLDLRFVKSSNLIAELTQSLTGNLSNIIANNNLGAAIQSGTIQVTKSKGDKILFHFPVSDKRIKPRMILHVYRDYVQGRTLTQSLLENLAQKRLDDLQRYMDNIMKEKDSKEYKEFYKRIDIVKNQNMFEFYSTIHEYEALLNKTHIFNTATLNSNIDLIFPLGISVKIDEVFDTTATGTIYKKDNPFETIQIGDKLTFE